MYVFHLKECTLVLSAYTDVSVFTVGVIIFGSVRVLI